MNTFLRDRIVRKIDTLSDDRMYQVLDYVEFLESKYAERQAPTVGIFTRFAETVEDQLRAGRVSATAIAETMNLMNRAMGVLTGVAAAGKSVASDIVSATRTPDRPTAQPAATVPDSAATPPQPPGAPPPPPGEHRS